MKHTLVIGYGNTLRADDGAGIRAAEGIADRFPDADVLTVHQLQPELAESISHYAKVVFLDAAVEGSGVRIIPVHPAWDYRPDGSHGHSPEALLALCSALYGHAPEQSLLVAIPGRRFDFGEQLSPFTERMIDQAIEEVEHFLLS